MLPEARSGRLQPVGPDKIARLKLTYKVLGSAFHDGTKTSAADLLYAYAFAYRWGAPRQRRGGALRPRTSTPPRRPCAGISLGVRIAGVDTASKSFRVGDVNFVREIFTVEVYLDDRAGGAGMERRGGAAVEHAALARAGADGGGGRARLGGVLAARRRAGAASPWLDLVRSDELSAKLAALAAEFERDGYRPQALRAHVSRGGGAQALGGARSPSTRRTAISW